MINSRKKIVDVSTEIIKRKEKLKMSYHMAIVSAVESKDDNLVDMVIEVLTQSMLYDKIEFIEYTKEIFNDIESLKYIINKIEKVSNESV